MKTIYFKNGKRKKITDEQFNELLEFKTCLFQVALYMEILYVE